MKNIILVLPITYYVNYNVNWYCFHKLSRDHTDAYKDDWKNFFIKDLKGKRFSLRSEIRADEDQRHIKLLWENIYKGIWSINKWYNEGSYLNIPFWAPGTKLMMNSTKKERWKSIIVKASTITSIQLKKYFEE